MIEQSPSGREWSHLAFSRSEERESVTAREVPFAEAQASTTATNRQQRQYPDCGAFLSAGACPPGVSYLGGESGIVRQKHEALVSIQVHIGSRRASGSTP